ncbi:MAG TPA: transporter substrate-binding domain-containing protein [Vicinamibacteria bacterium]|nr:transporter substrate-binding domain-containing protein [Vicinamibacteria bacterium]
MRSHAILGAAILAASAAGPARADWAEIQKRGSLRVLVMLDTRRPEFFSVQKEAPGFDHEVLQGFAALQKVKLDLAPVESWDALLPALGEGKGDLIAGRFTVTESRTKVVSFTTEVFPTRNVVINRKPRKPITSLEGLRSEKVGTIKGTSMAEAIAEARVPAANVDDGLPAGSFGEALKSGRVTAAVWGVESAIALQREDPEIQLGLFLGPPRSLAYAVRKDDRELLARLDAYVENLRKTPTWSRLVVKYFGAAAPEILKRARTQ